jgi:hypothetical protein
VDPDNRFFFEDGTDFGVSPLLLSPLLLFLLFLWTSRSFCFGVSGAAWGSGRAVPGFHILVVVVILCIDLFVFIDGMDWNFSGIAIF